MTLLSVFVLAAADALFRTFAAALVPTVAIGFNWKRATKQAAITAIVVQSTRLKS